MYNDNMNMFSSMFLTQKIFTSSYKLRIESMLLKAEFEANMAFLEPSIESMLAAGQGNLILTLLEAKLKYSNGYTNID